VAPEDGITLWPDPSHRAHMGAELQLAVRHTDNTCNSQKLQQLRGLRPCTASTSVAQ